MPRTSLFLCAIQISVDRLLSLLWRVFVTGHTASLNVRKSSLEIILGEREIRNEQVVRDVFAAVQNLLSDPEGKRRHAGRNRCGPGRITILSLLLFPKGEFVLAISHDDRGQLASGRAKGLPTAVSVATLVNHADNFGERRQNRRDRLLCRSLVPIAFDAIDNLKFRMLLDSLCDPGMDRVIDRGTSQTTDF